MSTIKPKDLSAFGEAALALDAEFAEFERLAREIERLSIGSDKGLERGRTLLVEIDSCNERMALGMQGLSRTLDEARQRSEDAAKLVCERALEIQTRHREAEAMMERFKALGEMVKQINVAVTSLKNQNSADVTDEDRAVIESRMPDFNTQMGILVEEARKLMEDAREANMKDLERNADSLRQSLQSARHKLNLIADRQRDRTPTAAPGPEATH